MTNVSIGLRLVGFSSFSGSIIRDYLVDFREFLAVAVPEISGPALYIDVSTAMSQAVVSGEN